MDNSSLAMELGLRMCELWGIDPHMCRGIDVHWRPNDLPSATVELYLNEGVVRELLTLMPIERAVLPAEPN